MMNIVLLDTSYPINTRNQKIIDSFKKYYPDSVINVITWDRRAESVVEVDNYHIYRRISPYGHQIMKLLNLLGFRRFVIDKLKSLNPNVVIASHWDTLVLLPKLRKDQMLIYENLDLPTGSTIIRNIEAFAESRALRRVNLMIHASRFFEELYPKNIHQVVLENKPVFDVGTAGVNNSSKKRIAFLGTIRYYNILCNLVDAVKGKDKIELLFYGDGPDYNSIFEYTKGIKNIRFYGRYKYSDIVQLYNNADVIWAVYPNKDFNVKYAISNKFHESIALEKPCIFADKTRLGKYVVEKGIGLVVDPYSVGCISDLFDRIVSNQIDFDEMICNIRKQKELETSWDTDFTKICQIINDFIY